jgi:hypothetical protein
VGVIEKGGRNSEWTKNEGYLFSFSLFKIDRKVDGEFIFSSLFQNILLYGS